MPTARKLESLVDALRFVAEHGGAVSEVPDGHPAMRVMSYAVSGWNGSGRAGAAVLCADGAAFVIKSEAKGPYSELTPCDGIEVELIGWLP